MQPTDHLSGVDQSCLLLDQAAVGEDGEIRYALDSVPGGKLRVPFGVYLKHDSFARYLRGGTGNVRCRHAAGAAPVRPEVDENWNLGSSYDLIEERRINSNRFLDRREGLLTSSATACIGKMRSRYPILCTACLTGPYDWHEYLHTLR